MALTVLFLASLPLLSLLLLISYSLLFTKNNKKNTNNSSFNLPQGPTKLPIIGNLHLLGKLPHRSLLRLSRHHGSLMSLTLGAKPTVVVSSASVAEQFMKTHDLSCCTRPYLTSTSKLSYNCKDIAFAPYGPLWRDFRKTSIIEFFSSKKVQKFQAIREEEVTRMITSISTSSGSINLSAALLSLSNDITCRAALGKRYYNGEGEESCSLQEMLKETQAMVGGLFFADYVPALGWLDVVTGMRRRLERNFRELDKFYERVIEEHLEESRGVEGGEDTMDALLRIQKEEAGNITREHIKAILMV